MGGHVEKTVASSQSSSSDGLFQDTTAVGNFASSGLSHNRAELLLGNSQSSSSSRLHGPPHGHRSPYPNSVDKTSPQRGARERSAGQGRMSKSGGSPSRSCSIGSRKREARRSRSRTADRKRLPSEMKMSRERPKTVSTQPPSKKRLATYGFDHKQCANYIDATNLFTMRLVAPRPGEPLPVTYDTSPVKGGGFQCILRPNRRCSKLLWDSTERCFVGEIREERRSAEQSAAEKFWQDADVLKKAETLPPSKREMDKLKTTMDYKNHQKKRNQERRIDRLAEKRARNAR